MVLRAGDAELILPLSKGKGRLDVALDLLADREERDFKAIQPSTPSLQMGVVVLHGATVLGVVTGSESCFWPGEVPLPACHFCCF